MITLTRQMKGMAPWGVFSNLDNYKDMQVLESWYVAIHAFGWRLEAWGQIRGQKDELWHL